MNQQIFSWPRFERVPIVGILRGYSLSTVKKIVPYYISAGLSTIEITMNTPSAGEIIRFLTANYSDQLNIGAGTVCNIQDLEAALDANAQFIVSPIVQEDVIRHCVGAKIPVFPGAFTPTEVYRAWDLGASRVKVFPSGLLGPAYIRELKAPLNQIKLLPTGGINWENLSEYMEAGADGLGIGSGIFPKKDIESEDWNALTENFKRFGGYFNP